VQDQGGGVSRGQIRSGAVAATRGVASSLLRH
jgi:hypothetical protein